MADRSQDPEVWLRGQDLHLRLEVMSLSYCPTLLPRHKSGTTRRRLVRVAGVEPAWTCAQDMWVAATLHPDLLFSRIREGLAALSCLAFHADHLAQRVNHVYQIALRFHHGVDRLVRHRRFVDDVRILTALDASCCFGMVIQGKAALRFCT
jgi:hypothetical protein